MERALKRDANDAVAAYRVWAHEERNWLHRLYFRSQVATDTASLLRSDSAELRLRAQELRARRWR